MLSYVGLSSKIQTIIFQKHKKNFDVKLKLCDITACITMIIETSGVVKEPEICHIHEYYILHTTIHTNILPHHLVWSKNYILSVEIW